MEIRSREDIVACAGKEVTLTGTYVESIIAQRPDPDMDNEGRYRIRVNDSLDIVLLPPYNEQSQRPQEEIDKMAGKKVRVTGKVIDRTYMQEPSLQYESQWVSIPCFTEITSIELVEE